MHDIEARELRYFIAVADELNFSRAAERLGIAQPPLSRAIRQLETRLGVQLFERSPRRVALTAAGDILLEEGRRALAAMSAAARRTRRAGSGDTTLAVTAKPGVATGLLVQIVERYAVLPATPQVEIVVSGYREQADMVRDGRADVALLSSPYDARGLDAEPLTTEPRVAALPAGHELARRSALRCRDLDGLAMPTWPDSTPDERAYWWGRDRDAVASGSPEPDGPVVGDGAQLLEVVSLGQAVALIPEALARRNPRPDIAYRPVRDATPYTIAIAWPDGSRAHAIALFVRTAIELTAADGGGELARYAAAS